jgi:hypothetical protein
MKKRPDKSGLFSSINHFQLLMGRSRFVLTRSRKSLPGLKWGTNFPDKATASPVFGFLPMRGGRKCREKLPNPRISIRSPEDNELLINSSRCLTASSTSLGRKCFCFRPIPSINSDFVIAKINSPTGCVGYFPKSIPTQVSDLPEIFALSKSPRLVPAPLDSESD